MENKTLIAAPFFGEFGWHLFRWQGIVRKMSREFEHTIVYCEDAYAALYVDFAGEIHKINTPELNRGMLSATYNGTPYNYIFPHVESASMVLPGGWLVKTAPEQEFIEYGLACQRENIILFHARNAQHIYRNWSVESWMELNNKLSYDAISIGTVSGALHVPGTVDARGIPLSELISLMRRAKVLASPSSGPVHLAALCLLPHVVWSDSRRWAMGLLNKDRYEKLWNPFDAPCTVILDDEWNPSVDAVKEALWQYL